MLSAKVHTYRKILRLAAQLLEIIKRNNQYETRKPAPPALQNQRAGEVEILPLEKKSNIFVFCSLIRIFAPEMIKNLYIISGCNGAGKTTASYTVLPEILDCKEFVNADEIARGLSPFNPESVAIEAGRLMLKRIDELLEKDATFSIETKLATKSYVK